MEKLSRLLDNANIKGMIKALAATKAFDIDKTTDTIIVTHTKSGTEVLRALKNRAIWITRYNKNLFE